MNNDYEIKINKLVGVLLEAEENYQTVQLILDADMAYDVATLLRDELDKDFFYECEEDDFDYLLKNNNILSITICIDKDKVLYFLEEAIYNDITLECDADTFYIHESIINKLDMERLHGGIVILSESDEDEDDEDYEKEIQDDLDSMFEDIVDDAMSEINECIENDEEFCLHCVIKDAVQMAYKEGYRNAILMLNNATEDILDDME